MRFRRAKINITNNNGHDTLSIAILILRGLASEMASYDDIENFSLPVLSVTAKKERNDYWMNLKMRKR